MSVSCRLASGSGTTMTGPLMKVHAYCRVLWRPNTPTSGLTVGSLNLSTHSGQQQGGVTVPGQGATTNSMALGLGTFNSAGLAMSHGSSKCRALQNDSNMIGLQGLGGFGLSQHHARPISSYSGHKDTTSSDQELSATQNNDETHAEEQQREHVFSSGRARDTVERVDAMAHVSLTQINSSCHQDSGETSGNASGMTDYNASEQYNSSGSVSLHGVMQSNVPEPFSPNDRGNPTHMNMPGGGQIRQDKYIQGHIKDVHPSRQFSTSTRFRTQSSFARSSSDEFLDSSVQGVQGEDCARYRLWLQNCKNYNFNCEEQLQGVQSGHKTLAEVFEEQERLIEQIIKDFEERKKSSVEGPDTQGVQGTMELDVNDTVEKLIRIENPCPQGIQGDECDRFRLWLENCVRYGFVNCNDDLKQMKKGRKTLGQIFAEQDAVIRSIVQQSRKYSTSASSDGQDPQKQKATEAQWPRRGGSP